MNCVYTYQKLDSYDGVVEKVANKHGVDDPSKIWLTSHNIYSQQPKAHPKRYQGAENLLEMLLHYNQLETHNIRLPEESTVNDVLEEEEGQSLIHYDAVVERVANQLGVDDPSKMRLTSHNIYSQQSKAHPIRYQGVQNLLEMLLHPNQLESHIISLPEESAVSDVLEDLRKKGRSITPHMTCL
ncbi:ubiquitin carboxyl-terminal hydrolase 12-like [Sesamum indicum]|uniref:Ubiquitin carboxyl-terminal hydrolase 12-like n=1 Tax=Sesamum indicum TaxID=4182 RepID=A0A8M8V7X3_SESIN|nr:ubiquitin carboxyl-terminal hydrolase 12-like [Sesamum indicum]